VIRLGTAVLAEPRAERVSRQVCQLPITVAAKDAARTTDNVVYAGNVFVAIPPARSPYEVVDYLSVVGWIRKQTQQKLGSRMMRVGSITLGVPLNVIACGGKWG